MSRFMEDVHSLARLMAIAGSPSARDQESIELGRVFACQFIDETRDDPNLSNDALMAAVALGGKAGDQVLRGFLAEIADLIKETRP